MPNLHDALERLESDQSFKDWLVRDPQGALQGYDLTPDDVSVIAMELSDDFEVLGFVEQRTSKAGLFALISNASHAAPAAEGGTEPTEPGTDASAPADADDAGSSAS
jgi:hypothetical protein